MIFNTDFYKPTDALISFNFKHVIDEIIHDWHYIYTRLALYLYLSRCPRT